MGRDGRRGGLLNRLDSRALDRIGQVDYGSARIAKTIRNSRVERTEGPRDDGEGGDGRFGCFGLSDSVGLGPVRRPTFELS